MKSFLVCKFTYASCSSSNIGETCRHFKTRIEEHIKIFEHLHSTTTCFDSYNPLCFKIIDKANSKFDLKLKKHYILTGENITWMRNKIIYLWPIHYSLCSPLLFSVFVCCFLLLLFYVFLFHLLFSLSLTLIIGIFFATTSSHYNTLCITSFSFIYCFHYLHTNYRHLLVP